MLRYVKKGLFEIRTYTNKYFCISFQLLLSYVARVKQNGLLNHYQRQMFYGNENDEWL
jgi:hypothetical protein